jgi:hypothetical protein
VTSYEHGTDVLGSIEKYKDFECPSRYIITNVSIRGLN